MLVFLAVLVPAAVTLMWLGLRLLAEDRALVAQLRRERQEFVADAVIQEFVQLLRDAHQQLRAGAPVEGALRIDIGPNGSHARPPGVLLWNSPTRFPEADAHSFAAAELLEFGGRSTDALRQYQAFKASPHAPLRAGALLRIARIVRQGPDPDAAVAAYEALAAIRDVAIDGMPVDLLARRAACDVLAKAGRQHELAVAARTIEADLLAGRWALDRAGWELSVTQLESWLRRSLNVDPVRKALSSAPEWLSEAAQGEGLAESGHRLVTLEGVPLTVLWLRAGSHTSALVLPPEALIREWSRIARQRDKIKLDVASGQLVVGEPSIADFTVRRLADETGLPWTVTVASMNAATVTPDLGPRRTTLGLGFGAIVMLLAGGSYLLWRVVKQELAVATHQAEFVSAVSHEFRTPLTSLAHVTELLQEDDEKSTGQRQAFYQILARNTERLRHLVESLLDFARMEAGRKPYELRPTDVATLVEHVVEEFRRDLAARGIKATITLSLHAGTRMHADSAALGHALWNLLDNAVKYSSEEPVIEVSLRRHQRGLCLAVTDRGIGIPRHERASIFAKFVRGEQARRRGIHGTGVGLAIVAHIVDAHQGAIELHSEEGKGSTFSMVLPTMS